MSVSNNNKFVLTQRTMSIAEFAKEHQVDPKALAELNGLSGSTIPEGTSLRIPEALSQKDMKALGLTSGQRVSTPALPAGGSEGLDYSALATDMNGTAPAPTAPSAIGNAPAVSNAALTEKAVADVVRSSTGTGAERMPTDSAIGLMAQALREGGVPFDSPKLKELLTGALGGAAAAKVLSALQAQQSAPAAPGTPPAGTDASELNAAPVPAAELDKLRASQAKVVDAGVGPYEVKDGETLEAVAKAFDTTPEQLVKMNPGLKPGQDVTGLVLNVPIGSSKVQAEATAQPLPAKGKDAYATPAPSMDAVRAGKGVIQRGMSGQSVTDIQKMLNAAGASPPLALDGKFGPKTEAALRAFQAKHGVQQTGVCGAPSLDKLEKAPPAPPGSLPVPYADRTTLTGSALGTSIGDRAEREARRLNSFGACALGVNNVLQGMGIGGRGHAFAKAEQLAKDSRFREVNPSRDDLANLPRGAVVVWGKSEAKPWGHVSIALGNGTEASDHIEQQKRGGEYGTDFGNGPDPHGRQYRVFLPA